MSEINLYDVVRLNEDVPHLNLKDGMRGTAIDTLAGGAWLVEFEEMEDEDGFPIAYGFYSNQLAVVTPFSEMNAANAAKSEMFSHRALVLK